MKEEKKTIFIHVLRPVFYPDNSQDPIRIFGIQFHSEKNKIISMKTGTVNRCSEIAFISKCCHLRINEKYIKFI